MSIFGLEDDEQMLAEAVEAGLHEAVVTAVHHGQDALDAIARVFGQNSLEEETFFVVVAAGEVDAVCEISQGMDQNRNFAILCNEVFVSRVTTSRNMESIL